MCHYNEQLHRFRLVVLRRLFGSGNQEMIENYIVRSVMICSVHLRASKFKLVKYVNYIVCNGTGFWIFNWE